MTDYFVSNTYKDWERIGSPYDKDGKLYTKVKCQCDRCVKGVYICRVENNQPVPHPAYGGVCLKCGGTGYLTKEVRLYTAKEFETKEKAAARAKEKKAAELEAKMKAEFATKKAEWMEKNGFNAEGATYIITGDSYSIKEELKAAGWKFDSVLLWHKADPAGYEDRVIKVSDEEIIEYSAWGEGHFKTGAKEYIMQKMLPAEDLDLTFIGEVGDKLKQITVTLTKKNSFCGRFGLTNILEFRDENKNYLVWFTSTEPKFEIGDKISLSGTIKEHKKYKEIPQTIVTRCKLSSLS
jgi:hypothetical protein